MQDPKVVSGSASIRLGERARRDGYRPLAVALLESSVLLRAPDGDAWMYLVMAARRLDYAHAAFERLRSDLDEYDSENPRLAKALRILSHAEMSVTGLYRAVDMTLKVKRQFCVIDDAPTLLVRRREGLRQLRNAYEHIDQRALGFTDRGVLDRKSAHSLFRNAWYLFDRRLVRYRRWSLPVDEPVTRICLACRRYLRKSWEELA